MITTKLSPTLQRAFDRLDLDPIAIEAFCHRWHIVRLALFGSVLRDDFCDQSDVDLLLSFEADYRLTWGGSIEIQAEAEAIFGRSVDLVNLKYL
ncbi:MAG: nucleotidyltransferase family protein, partial [Prochlorothrix sp.]